MSKFIFSLILFCCPFLLFAQEASEYTAVVKKMNSGHQLRFSFDVSKVLLNSLIDNRTTYEFAVDYYLKKEVYGVAEFGAGNSNINYPDLKYQTTNTFLRLGIDKALFVRKKPQDWGLGFFGFRYGLGLIQRNEAQYTTNDGLGGITSGTLPTDNFTAHWFELTGGMKLELIKGFFAGWTVRAKFLFNQKSFGDLKPAYIAGYGLGEKSTAFDYNFYLGYGIRWSRKK
jgi:hypothetical protein